MASTYRFEYLTEIAYEAPSRRYHLRAAAALMKMLNWLRAVAPPPADKTRIKEWLAGGKLKGAGGCQKLNAGQKGAAEHMGALLNGLEPSGFT